MCGGVAAFDFDNDGNVDLFGPAPQSTFDADEITDRAFSCVKESQPEAEIEAYLAREIRFDSDIWIVEVEDRAGRHMLDQVVL